MTDKQELARERTDWAEDRTILANERTFAGWLRTGMGAVAVAIGLAAVFREADPAWLAKAVSTIFVGAGVFMFVGAALRSHAAQRRISSHSATPTPARRMLILAAILTAGAVATGAILWTL